MRICAAPRCTRKAKLQVSVPSYQQVCCLRHIRWALAEMGDWPVVVTPIGELSNAELRAHTSIPLADRITLNEMGIGR